MFAIIIQSSVRIYYMSVLVKFYVGFCFIIEMFIFNIFVLACLSSKENVRKLYAPFLKIIFWESEVVRFGFQIKFIHIMLILYCLGCAYFHLMSFNYLVFKW